jgi:hypothetical protein
MLELPGAPRRDHGSAGFFSIEPISAFEKRICVALEHDQRGGARRMCRRERAAGGKEDCFATAEIVEHGGDAVGPLLQGRQRGRRDRIGCSGARLVEENQPTD